MRKNFTNKDVELAIELVHPLLPNTREERISSKELREKTGLKPRQLKDYIAILRVMYPICTMLGTSGGYWIAQTADDMNDFISKLETRRNTMNETISIMRQHQESLI